MKNTINCIDDYFKQHNIENIALRVGRGDRILFEHYRAIEGRIDENTLFDIASVTKMVATTSLALIAMEKGLLAAEDTLDKFPDCPGDTLDKFPECPGDKRAITIKQLMTHTSGLGYRFLTGEDISYENVEKHILGMPCAYETGSKVQYSCLNFILLGRILERVLGKRLDVAFREYVAEPLGMTSTMFLPGRRENMVDCNYHDRSAEGRYHVGDVNCSFLGGICGNAGLFSNMTDLTTYVKMLLAKGAPIMGEEILKEASYNYTAELNEARGLGFVYVDSRYAQTGNLFEDGAIGHCGHSGQSVFVDRTTGLYVIILSDATVSTIRKYGTKNYGEVMKLREDIHNAIREDLL